MPEHHAYPRPQLRVRPTLVHVVMEHAADPFQDWFGETETKTSAQPAIPHIGPRVPSYRVQPMLRSGPAVATAQISRGAPLKRPGRSRAAAA